MKKFKMAWSRSEKKHRNLIEKETEFGFEVESLESRKMLAGNVDVVVKADNSLVITGDSADNSINVIDGQGDIFVLGVDGTIVANGGSTGLALTDLNKLTIKMKGGDDQVTVGPLITAAGKVRMTGAAGNDQFIFEGTAQDRVQIIGGGGIDSISVSGTFNGKVTLNSGGGDDLTHIAAATFATDVKANMGHGADQVFVVGVSFADARFNLGSGSDVLILTPTAITITGEVILNGGGGFDYSSPDPDTIALFPNWIIKSFEGTF
jgi:hypothetical protein